MYPKQVAQDTAKVLQSYLTYQAVKTVHAQLSETNPSLAIWLSQYSASHNVQDGEAYLKGLISQNKDLCLRIMTVREHLAEAVLDFLAPMVHQGIQASNLENRRLLLERLTQSQSEPETASSELDSNQSSD